jgi:hypothetical protein
MDLVTKNILTSFKNEESFPPETNEPTLFEHFANYCVISQDYGEEFDVDGIHTGGGDDLGIDGLGIIVNGALVSDPSEVEDLATANKYIEAKFIFCQAKTGVTSPEARSPIFSLGLRICSLRHRRSLKTTPSKRRRPS